MTFTHSKSCLARSIISAVENFRDNSDIDAAHFRAMIGGIDSALLSEADGYLNDGLSDCYCVVGVAKRVVDYINEDDLYRAQSYATAELQNGVITDAEYQDLVDATDGRLSAACVHHGLSWPKDDDLEGYQTCPSCRLSIWNGHLQ